MREKVDIISSGRYKTALSLRLRKRGFVASAVVRLIYNSNIFIDFIAEPSG